MFAWLKSREREMRQLNKDAGTIVEMARETYRSQLQHEIAASTRDAVAHIAQLCAGDETCLRRELERVKTLHRESRSKHDQVGLTAHTLTIIYVRSWMVGDGCAPARQVIDDYVAQWAGGPATES